MSRLRRFGLGVLGAILVGALMVTATQLAGISSKFVHRAAGKASLATDLLGFDHPKRYLLAFQNLAEARGTGGLLGAYAVIEFRNGNFRVLQQGSDSDLKSLATLPIPMPAEYLKLYGHDPAIWQNSNLSPHFPDAARIWLALWQKQTKQNLDGVIAVDPVLISSVLAVIGAIRMPSGELINADNVVRKTLSDAYVKYDGKNEERKRYLVELMTQVLQKLKTASDVQFFRVLGALAAPAKEGRLLVYSVEPEIQKALSRTPFGGILSNMPNNEYRAIIINTDGSKLDFYTRVRISVKPTSCLDGAETEIAVKVTNSFDGKTRLPDYVWGRLDKNRPQGLGGAHAMNLMVFGPSYSEVLSVRRERYELGGGYITVERRRPLAVFALDLKPGLSETVRVSFSGGSGSLSFKKQPLVNEADVRIVSCTNK